MAQKKKRSKESRDHNNRVTREKRALRRASLHKIVGSVCKCGQPATCLVSPDPRPTGLRDGSSGPGDAGLHRASTLILAVSSGRVPMCRSCQVGARNRHFYKQVVAQRLSGQYGAMRLRATPPEVRMTHPSPDLTNPSFREEILRAS